MIFLENIETTVNETLFKDSQKLALECEKKLGWHLKLGKEYTYSSLVFCIIDAIFSIGVHYSSAEKAVNNYACYYHLTKYNTEEVNPNHTVSDFIKNYENIGDVNRFASEVLCNLQKTSSIKGITKAEACYLVAKVFQKYSIETISDFRLIPLEKEASLIKDIRAVKGQRSGIMIEYLFMLIGDENRCKPDRHLVGFVSDVLAKKYQHSEISELIYAVYNILKTTHSNLTVRYLDYLIWNYQRNNGSK